MFIYSEGEYYESRVSLIKSTLEAFGITIKFKGPVGDTDADSVISSYMGSIKKEMNTGGAILALLHDDQSSALFRQLYIYLNATGEYQNSEEMAEDYTVYLFDNTNTYFDPLYAKGHYVSATTIWDETINSQYIFTKYFEYIAPTDHYGLEDILMTAVFKWLTFILQQSSSFDTASYKKEMYLHSVPTIIGNFSLQGDNHFLYSINEGVINGEGKVEYQGIITNKWRAETYRTVYNLNSFTNCDWNSTIYNSSKGGDKIELVSIKIGLLLPRDNMYRKDAMLLYTSFYSWIDKINYENGGVKGFFILIKIMEDGNDPEYARKQIINAYENYRCIVFLGAWSSSIRQVASEVADKYNLLFFFPTDYEGEVCYYNCYSTGIAYSSFVYIYIIFIFHSMLLFQYY